LETIEVSVDPREAGNKRVAGRLRREGKLPGVFYGPKTNPIPLQVSTKELLGSVPELEGSHLIRMKSKFPILEDKVALIKDVQFHPVTGEILHFDLYEVDLTQKILVKIPLHFVGKPKGVIQGGILQPILREIEVECLPMDIPEFLNVDVTSLEIGHSFHVRDLQVPEGVLFPIDLATTLVTVAAPIVEEAPKVEEAPLAAPEGAEAPTPAVDEEKETESKGS
jgi:large subunit ribosomal protein L25